MVCLCFFSFPWDSSFLRKLNGEGRSRRCKDTAHNAAGSNQSALPLDYGQCRWNGPTQKQRPSCLLALQSWEDNLLRCLLSRNLLWLFSLDRPGDLALKLAGIFGESPVVSVTKHSTRSPHNQQFTCWVVREEVIAETFLQISAKFPQTFRSISAPFPDIIKRIFCKFPQKFCKLSAKTPSPTTP